MAFESFNPRRVDAVREAAVNHTLAHPRAEIPPPLRKQITVAESYIVAEEAYREPETTLTERIALEQIMEGADEQIAGLQSVSKGGKIVRGAIIGALTLGASGYLGYKAVETATEIPGLAIERAAAEFPVEIGTEEVTILGVNVTVPSFTETEQIREDRIVEAQEALDEAKDTVVSDVKWAGGILGGGIAATTLVSLGFAPGRTARRLRGKVLQQQGWKELGMTKDELRTKLEEGSGPSDTHQVRE